MRARVLMAEPGLPHYRVALFESLRDGLLEHGVQFDFLHGPSGGNDLPWARTLTTLRMPWGGKALWQPFDTTACDLVIVSHENALLFNHWLSRPWRPFRLGLFGHGANLAASSRQTAREHFKRFTLRRADWWFGYTTLSQRLAMEAGFPPERITVVDNATDTIALRQQMADTPDDQLKLLRQAQGLTPGHTGLFLGTMYAGKGLDRLIEAAALVQCQDPAFVLLMVGDGPARPAAQRATRDQAHIRWLGPLHGADKAALMAVSDFLCLPGAVGLAIVDAFAAGLPLLTTDAPGHGPEIAYLEPGRNGDITPPDTRAYADAVLGLLRDPVRLRQWRDRAASDGRRYTVQAMASRFGQGILESLAHPRR